MSMKCDEAGRVDYLVSPVMHISSVAAVQFDLSFMSRSDDPTSSLEIHLVHTGRLWRKRIEAPTLGFKSMLECVGPGPLVVGFRGACGLFTKPHILVDNITVTENSNLCPDSILEGIL